MEGPERRRGAGPETTGNENERPEAFVIHDDSLVDEGVTPPAPEIDDSTSATRSHVFGYPPDRRVSRDHPSVRGDRLESGCRRRDNRNN